MLDNPNIAAQERHNNREYLPGPFDYRETHECRECGKWNMKIITGICTDCRDKSAIIADAVERVQRMNRARIIKEAK